MPLAKKDNGKSDIGVFNSKLFQYGINSDSNNYLLCQIFHLCSLKYFQRIELKYLNLLLSLESIKNNKKAKTINKYF